MVASKLSPTAPVRRYLRVPVPVRFPESESVPETGVHLRLRTALWSMLRLAIGQRAMVGSDQFVYWDPTDPRQCLAPDVLVWMGAPDRPFSSWKVWERGAPHLAVEIVSESDARDRLWERKLDAYRHSGVVELVRFDAEDDQFPLRLWDRLEGDLVEREVSKTELEYSDVLGLFWLVEPAPDLGSMLRLSRDSAGLDRLLTDDEARHAADKARHTAEARVRELEAELARRRNEDESP
ncbi:MAG TPA: Uma2 family endonuclease [Polyangiaceae bacterium]|nr:Uma2 family endonuclease [Polyangiaceae bacterium]